MNTSLFLLCGLVAVCCATYPTHQKPFVRQNHYRTQDTHGQYDYGFDSDDGIKRTESRTPEGAVVGGYSYTSPEGQGIDIQYNAGTQGFVASGNAIPQPPPLPIANVRATEEHLGALASAPKTPYNEPQHQPEQYGPPPYISYNYKFSS